MNLEEFEGVEEKKGNFWKKYHHLIELINIPVLELDLNGVITYISLQCYDLFGFLPEELIGKSCFEFIHPEDINTIKRAIIRVSDSEDMASERYRIMRKNGSFISIIAKGRSIRFGKTPRILITLTKFGKEVEILNQIIKTSSLAKDINALLKDILETILEIMNFDGGGIYYVDKSNKTANIVYSEGLGTDMLKDVDHIEINDPRYKRIFIDGEPLFIENYHIYSPEHSKKSGLFSIASIPLIAKEEIIGALNIGSKNRYKFSDEEKIIFNSLSREIGNVIVRLQSEEKYRLISENARDMILIFTTEFNIEYINEEPVNKILGYNRLDLLDKKAIEFVHPEEYDFVSTEFLKALKIGKVFVTLRVRHKNGSYIWIESSGTLFRDFDGKDKFLFISRDINERKLMEQYLKESEENFRNIAEQSVMGICIIQDDLFRYVNKKLADLYGYSVEEMLNWRPQEFIKVIAPDSLEMVIEQAKKKQLGLANVINHYIIHCIKKNGEKFWVENLSKTIIYKGRTADMIAQIDVTEKKKAEKELESLNKLKFDLITRTSHELKTPLMAIKGYSDLLTYRYGNSFSEDVLQIIEEIKRGSVKLESLIRDVITTAELDAGSVQLKKAEENLSLLIKSCVSDIDSFARSRNIIMDLKINEDLILYFEKKQIYHVVNNLLSNALKYTPKGGKIEIGSKKKVDHVIINIKDTGVGFTEEEKKQIFKQFGKIERYGQGWDVISDGTGLGLYISKRIVELHGGEIWMESEGRNKGSIFYFSLPLIKN